MRVLTLTSLAGWFLFAVPSQTSAQTGTSALAFEVASVKSNTSEEPRVQMRMQPGGRFIAVNQTLRGLIRFAYRLQDFQLVAPGWIDNERFDIAASAGRDTTPDELAEMLRTLLAMEVLASNLMNRRDAASSIAPAWPGPSMSISPLPAPAGAGWVRFRHRSAIHHRRHPTPTSRS